MILKDKIIVINLNEVNISPLKADLFIQDWVGSYGHPFRNELRDEVNRDGQINCD